MKDIGERDERAFEESRYSCGFLAGPEHNYVNHSAAYVGALNN